MNHWICVGIFLIFIGVNSQTLQKRRFSCQGRPSGYYADIDTGCQVYHMCDGLGRQFSYSCPSTTLFQQRMLICDHWYMVNCSKSEVDYAANLLIGQKEKPFVDDNDPYSRTPRPDLLADPSSAEFNIIYRMGRNQNLNSKNLINSFTDKFSNDPTLFDEDDLRKYKKTPVTVNFKSDFKATTPVYPLTAPTEAPILDYADDPGLILQPPRYANDRVDKNVDIIPAVEASPPVKVNFASNFKATTPVYPKFVDAEIPLAYKEIPLPQSKNVAYGLSTIVEPPRQNDNKVTQQDSNESKVTSVKVNFESNFKATTPVYPTAVTPEVPLAIQELRIDPNKPSLPTVILPPKSYVETSKNTIIEPARYYELPKPEDYKPIASTRFISTTKKAPNWSELRQIFFIPDYQFPLDVTAVRPSYETNANSFQPLPAGSNVYNNIALIQREDASE